MTDRHLFYLDRKRQWDLACDQQQWMIRRNKGPRKASPAGVGPGDSALYAWEAKWFAGSRNRILHQFISGKRGSGGLPESKRPRIELTAEALARLQALVPAFTQFVATLPKSAESANCSAAGAT